MSRSILQFVDGVNVKYYGATGDGETDDTAAIAVAIAAIPATGGVLYFPPGTYLTSGDFTLPVPVIVQGCGAGNILGDGAVTQINCNHATNSLFTVNSRRATFRDISLKCTHATPTAGAGVTVTSAYIHQRVDYDSISVYGFYVDVDVQVGAQWTMRNCFILNPVLYGLKIANTVNGDAGDWTISDSHFNTGAQDATAAIRIESSGGGKISGIKINRNPPGTAKYFANGIDLAATGDTTSILLITNSSFENVSGNAINVDTAGNWDYINIHGNQVHLYNSTGYAIVLDADASGDVDNVIIANNILFGDNVQHAAINLVNVNHAMLSGNIYGGFTALKAETTCTDIVVTPA
jgi:hypothetical protein